MVSYATRRQYFIDAVTCDKSSYYTPTGR